VRFLLVIPKIPSDSLPFWTVEHIRSHTCNTNDISRYKFLSSGFVNVMSARQAMPWSLFLEWKWRVLWTVGKTRMLQQSVHKREVNLDSVQFGLRRIFRSRRVESFLSSASALDRDPGEWQMKEGQFLRNMRIKEQSLMSSVDLDGHQGILKWTRP
jgi:hypothetical protein